MKANELRKLSIEELRGELEASLKEQFNLRMQKGSGQEIRPHLFKNVRRNIARINTLIHAKGREGDQA